LCFASFFATARPSFSNEVRRVKFNVLHPVMSAARQSRVNVTLGVSRRARTCVSCKRHFRSTFEISKLVLIHMPLHREKVAHYLTLHCARLYRTGVAPIP
jgi:hypothetical protein